MPHPKRVEKRLPPDINERVDDDVVVPRTMELRIKRKSNKQQQKQQQDQPGRPDRPCYSNHHHSSKDPVP